MSAQAVPMRLALLGNPNSGKTALFNQLTGSRQKVANYAGVTVERKEGRLHSPGGHTYAVLDLPGAYSLTPASLDEAITRDLCRGFYPGEAAPDVLVCVVDATNLRLHLRFALEVRELGQQTGKPVVLAVNMMDAARRRGIEGEVLVRVAVGLDGGAKRVEVVRSSGSPLLDQAAVEGLERWRFEPARAAGQPVAATVEIPVTFRLTDPGGS